MLNPTKTIPRTVTLRAWFDCYAYKLKAARNIRSGYIDARLKALDHNIISKYPDSLVSEFSPRQLLDCILAMSGLKWSYIGQVITWADEMFEECVRCGERVDNPFHKIKFKPILTGGEQHA